MTLLVKRQGRAEMLVAVIGRLGAEDHLDVFDARAVVRKATARHRGGVAALARLRIAPVDHAVAGEIRADHDVQQTALAACIDTRQALHRLADLPLARDDPQPAGLFRHQPAAVRHHRQAPRMLQAGGHHPVDHRLIGAHRRRPGLALEGGTLVRRIGRPRLQRRAAGLPARIRLTGRLSAGAARGGQNDQRGRGGGGDQAHG